MTSNANKDRTQEIIDGSEFNIISSYIPSEDIKRNDIIPKRLFDVNAMRLIETSTILDKTNLNYVAISYSCTERQSINLQDPNISWVVGFATPDWLEIVCEKVKAIKISYIWIDSICINQDSKEDKGLQVPLMGDYYHGAELVIVVLDDVLQYKDDILSSEKILKAIQDNIEYNTRYLSVPSWLNLEHYVAAHTLISIIAKSRWSKRVWTTQEIRLSKKAIYFIPKVTSITDVELSTLVMLKYMGASSQIENITKYMMELPIKMEVTESMVVESIMPSRNKRYLPITEVQQLLKGRSCQLEQDKIYGILGMLHYGKDLKVNYDLTLDEIEKQLYTLASSHGDNTWISGNGERHPHPGWGMAMRFTGGIPAPSSIALFSAPRIYNDAIEIVGSLCGKWSYVKELTPLEKPDTQSGPGYREVPLTKTCTSIITAISTRSNSMENCINALKSAFYLYQDESDDTLASIVNRNGLFDNFLCRFFLNGIGRWSAEKIKGKDEGALFANASVRLYAWYGFGRRLSLLEINTDAKVKNYRAVASVDQGQTSGFIMMIGLISKEVSVCIPVIKIKEKFKKVGGIMLVHLNELSNEIDQKTFSML